MKDGNYFLGQRLARLHHGGLYRVAPSKPATWEECLKNEVHLGRTQAEKWMRVAAHFTQEAVEAYGVEVLDAYARSLDRAKEAVPADLSQVTVPTPDGPKHLADIGDDDAKQVFRPAKAAPGLAPEAQAQIARIGQSLAPLGTHAHVNGGLLNGKPQLHLVVDLDQYEAMVALMKVAPAPLALVAGSKRAKAAKAKPTKGRASPKAKAKAKSKKK